MQGLKKGFLVLLRINPIVSPSFRVIYIINLISIITKLLLIIAQILSKFNMVKNFLENFA